MPRTYSDAAQLRDVYQTMFAAIADDEAMAGLVELQMVINFRLRDPVADIWVDGRTRPVATAFEPIGTAANLTAKLSADTMHQLLLGSLPLGRALLFRRLSVSGSKARAMQLEPLLHACQRTYPDIAAGTLGG
jgi:putative sterol carrier protein